MVAKASAHTLLTHSRASQYPSSIPAYNDGKTILRGVMTARASPAKRPQAEPPYKRCG